MSYKNAFFPEATLTPDIYWDHQPKEVRLLRGMDPYSVAYAARVLADKGYTIDVPIMVYQWDPVTIMGLRKVWGYAWVPSGNQNNIPVVPGLNFPGLPDYDPLHPPVGSIRVSFDAADYPAFDPPPPPPPPVPTNIVGSRIWGNVFSFGNGAKDAAGAFTVSDGQEVTENGVAYVAHRSMSLMGETLYFTRS